MNVNKVIEKQKVKKILGHYQIKRIINWNEKKLRNINQKAIHIYFLEYYLF